MPSDPGPDRALRYSLVPQEGWAQLGALPPSGNGRGPPLGPTALHIGDPLWWGLTHRVDLTRLGLGTGLCGGDVVTIVIVQWHHDVYALEGRVG